MGLLNIIMGKTPADHERTGDALVRDESWGEAKLSFETALEKIWKHSSGDSRMADRLKTKIDECKEALAMAHRQEADALMAVDCVEEALELFALARELTSDPQLKEALDQQILSARRQAASPLFHLEDQVHLPSEGPSFDEPMDDEDDHFDLLLGALPDDIQQAYRSYGYNFKRGYLALNASAFDEAVAYLTLADEENAFEESLVPLELATAHVNTGQADAARALLEKLVQHRPDLLPAFQLLCDIYWEEKNFDQAMQLIDALSPELASSMGAYLLKGETLLRAARNREARSFFQDLLKTYGWKEPVAIGLAKAHEALGHADPAIDIYGELISRCSGCGSRVDPSIKRKYADLSLAHGRLTPQVLEHYLALSQEDPANAVHYYRSISQIYAALGNDEESARFESIAMELARRQQ